MRNDAPSAVGLLLLWPSATPESAVSFAERTATMTTRLITRSSRPLLEESGGLDKKWLLLIDILLVSLLLGAFVMLLTGVL